MNKNANALNTDALSDELGALAVLVEDADADTGDEQPIFGEPALPVAPPATMRDATNVVLITLVVTRSGVRDEGVVNTTSRTAVLTWRCHLPAAATTAQTQCPRRRLRRRTPHR